MRLASLLNFIFALFACAVPGHAADFEVLEVNPVREACYFSDYITPDGFRFWLDTKCTPGGADARVSGTGTPASMIAYAKEEDGGWSFLQDGKPELGLDGALGYADTHGRAVYRSMNFGRVVRVSGPIVAGDAERLQSFLEEHGLIHCYEPGYCPFQNILSLDSPGGNLSEALKIAQFVRDMQFHTLLEPNATCASACSFVFLAGYSNYEGFYHSRRFAHETARLGVHRPSLALEDRAYSAQEVAAFFDLFDFVKSEAVRQFVDARFPMRSLGEMYATAPEDMFYVPVPQMSQFATIFKTPLRSPSRINRAGLLSLCAEEYAKDRGHVHSDLLTNLRSNDDTFITHVENDPFACYGARNSANEWIYDICLSGEDKCALMVCMTDFESECTDRDRNAVFLFMEDAFNGSMGYALSYSQFNRKEMIRLALLGKIDKDWSHRLRRIGSWIATAEAPSEFCGTVDYRTLENASLLQSLLNASGFDAGPVDGKPGGRTFNAVAEANAALLNAPEDSKWVITSDLMRALGATEDQISAMAHCS